jgi:hypothetical protein
VGPDLELLHRLLIDVWRPVHAVLFDPSWQWDRTSDFGASAFRGFHDIGSAFVKHSVVVGPKADSDSLIVHLIVP